MSEEHESASPPHHGLAQRLASNLVGLAHNHLSLLGLELEEERERLLAVVILALVGAGVLWLGLGVLSVAVVWWVSEPYRWIALLIVALIYLLGGALCLWGAWRTILRAPQPFAATLEQLRKDREQLLP
ncbi:putative membrane protein YqjE [Silvimonas terrae]|uniref:Putative membrane protein YqjE n=1 Tax=Silvimonas terrae TaxID=300266 RepID=A0A840RGZ7_9NEIS|nr:phage holin family protein [Silvimonas terrae]MBB5191553.1 putative membrane protein YqjE [Silvimonas terrae]